MLAPYPSLFGLPLAISVPNFMFVPQNVRLFWLPAALLGYAYDVDWDALQLK